MKKQIQILSITITTIFFSCGRHNAETAGTITAGVKELSTNSSLLSSEPELLLLDLEGVIWFNADPADPAIKLPYRPSARSASFLIDRNEGTKTIIQLNESLVVN